MHYEKSISTFLENIEYKLNYLHINLVYIPNAITFLIPYSSTSDGDKNIFMNKFITNLDFVLSQTLNFDYRIGIGGFAEDMTQIHYHYKCANSALKISKALQRDTKSLLLPMSTLNTCFLISLKAALPPIGNLLLVNY